MALARSLGRAAVAGMALGVALPALAHHSFAAYDVVHTRSIKDMVKTFVWANPHACGPNSRRPQSPRRNSHMHQSGGAPGDMSQRDASQGRLIH